MIRVLQVMGGMNRRGAETFIMNVYRKIDRSKVQFDFLVYSNEKQDYEDEIESLGGRVIHMPCPTGIKGYKSVSLIRKVIRQYGPYKAIHAQTLFNICYSLLAAKSFPEIVRISHSHSTNNTLVSSLPQRAYEWASAKIIRHYTQIMVACGEEAGVFLFGDKFKQDGIVLNNGIDLDSHTVINENACNKIKRQYDLEGKLTIGSVARFFDVKNHTFMVQIAEVLKKNRTPFKLLFVGNGDLTEIIQKQVDDADLHDDVILTGLRSDIKDLMFTFDVFLMPSHFEGNPVTLVEAQATGLPCVITNVITDKMDMGLGLIKKCSLKETPDKWAEIIVKTAKCRCNDEQKIRKQISLCGYDAQATAQKLLNIYLK